MIYLAFILIKCVQESANISHYLLTHNPMIFGRVVVVAISMTNNGSLLPICSLCTGKEVQGTKEMVHFRRAAQGG